ncbi:hypothetical protein SSX86_019617 [Deinandra increscens subsp. villosa]|uniref:Transcription repressor n=1 Tax=Deinandra increscens subsp. villosa TaxID=3103831 RepID=A0AAP0GUR1_9ASTR
MPTLKNKLTTAVTVTTVGCGSSCRRINLSKIFHPKPKRNNRFYHFPTSTSRTFSPKKNSVAKTPVTSSGAVQGFGWLGGNGLAVEKDSSDPYVDFRDSMVQMIMEREIYGKDDLQELLNCFLQLNSPYYHAIILGAFTEIWINLSN